MLKRDVLSVRMVLAFAYIFGLAAAACDGPRSLGPGADLPDQPPPVLIPNVDDDDGDGVPDGSAPPLAAGLDDDVLQVRFDPYHRGGGEIHCGTNAARRGIPR